MIENLKDKYHYKLGRHLLELIFLSEIVESVNCLEVDQADLCEDYYKSSQLFFDKSEKAKTKITNVAAKKIRQERGIVLAEVDAFCSRLE